ncbi:hypothetical protein DEO72_LG11g2601 [Vigna unguiculata]|uniref:Uncharacterized protein n=1 Tax=Vigna unguiculata TaxID=3917 RepID=A0A4D6NNY7_VIGUN|nr:hypothetical protein DEO72_LG11g2601 [Vigna unguiculata]
MKAKRKINSGKPDCSNRHRHDNSDSTEKQEQSKHIDLIIHHINCKQSQVNLNLERRQILHCCTSEIYHELGFRWDDPLWLGPATKPVMQRLSEGEKLAGNGNAAVSGKPAGTWSSSRHRTTVCTCPAAANTR